MEKYFHIKKILITIIVISLFITIVGLTIVNIGRNILHNTIVGYESYIIKTGDTLWSIASNYYGDTDRYIPIIIEDIISKNNLNCFGDIYPGNILFLPIYWEE